MSHLPPDYAPYVRTSRRYLWLAQVDRTRSCEPGPASAFRARRLEADGTSLPTGYPSRTLLLAAGVLCVEEVEGASVNELLSYGLSLTAAEALIRFIEGYSMTTFNYGARAGQLYEEDDVSFVTSDAYDASFNSSVVETGDKASLRLDLVITARTGTAPTLHVQIETSDRYDFATFRVVDAFPVQSATGTTRRSMSGCDRFTRARCTLGGSTPEFTFSLSGTAL